MKGNRRTNRIAVQSTPPQRQSEEARLVERAKRGDQKAAGELYHRHVDAIYRYVYTRVRNEAVAEDLTAQVFLSMLKGLSGYTPSDKPFLAWLYRIACARTVDYWRKQQRRQEVTLDETWPANDPQPDQLVDMETDWVTAIDLLAQLTDDQQDVIILRFIGEMSLAEVAEILGKSVGAIKALQHRALASMSRLLQNQETEGRDE
jgi:RNA polymerase sigma-70 factor (ECF subfamily)